MRILLLLPLLLTVPGQNAQISTGDSSLVVLNFKWVATHRTFKKEVPNMAPPPEMTAGNKSAARAARVNNPMIPDPNENTIDGRSAAMEKAVQEARNTPGRSSADRFEYLTRIHNGADKPIDVIFWEYQFIDPANSNSQTRRQFLC